MRNKRLLVVLAGAALFGLVAAVTVSRYLSSTQAYARNLDQVVVAKVDIPIGTRIVAEQLTTAQFPRDAMPNGIFNSTENVVGRVAVVNIAAREPVTDFRLAPEGSMGGLSAIIPEGYRAMTVRVNDVVGVAGFLQPNAMVDVVVVIEPNGRSGGNDTVSKIVLQNIKVLAVGQNLDRPDNDREATSVRAVTLQVTPEQAEKLALASTEGKLQLVMRSATDQGDEQTQGVDRRSLLTGERAQPAPEPGALRSEQPARPAEPTAPARRAPRPRVEAPREEPRAQTPAPPAAPRNSVEMIEGARRRSVDFP